MEIGEVVKLEYPTDVYFVLDGTFARLPMGLPVIYVAQKPDCYHAIEPHGSLIFVPKTPVSRQDLPLDKFLELGMMGPKTMMFSEYPSKEQGVQLYERHAHPEKHRWYVDELRKRLGRQVYSDWECGYAEGGIRLVIKAARELLFDIDGKPSYEQKDIDAICDITLLQLEDDSPGWYGELEDAEALASTLMVTVINLFDHMYFVKSGGHWYHDYFEREGEKVELAREKKA